MRSQVTSIPSISCYGKSDSEQVVCQSLEAQQKLQKKEIGMSWEGPGYEWGH
jgi:hypothetical protein